MVTLASFDNTEQAELLKSQLEHAGIQAFIANAALVTLKRKAGTTSPVQAATRSVL